MGVGAFTSAGKFIDMNMVINTSMFLSAKVQYYKHCVG